MPRFLSSEWLSALDAAAQHDAALAAATRSVALVIQQEVRGGPDGDVVWHVDVADGAVRVRPGPAAVPDVTFSQDHTTALAVGRGELSAQTAFMLGKLRVGGDVGLLLQHQDAFDAVDDVFAAVRAATEF